MSPNNIEKIVTESAPEYAEAVMQSYRHLSDMIARELTASPAIANKLREADERLKKLEMELINGVKQKADPDDRKQLVADFASKMDEISYDVIQLENKPTVDVPREKEHRVGGIYEKAEVTDIVEQYSHAEMLEMLGALAESTKLTEKQNFRRQQIGMLKEFLSTLHWEAKESDENVLSKSTWAERWKQIKEPSGETHARIIRISNLIQSLDEVERQIIEDPNKTVNELLSSEIKAKMKEFDFAFDKEDPKQRADIQRQYVALIEFMRSRGNYVAAQTLMEENLLGPYFKEEREKLSDSDKASAKRRARSKIGKMVNEDVLKEWSKEWTKKGIPLDKHDEINREYIEGLVDHESKRQMNKVIAKENNGYPFKLHGWEKAIQEQYRDMMGYGDWHNFSDETWDMIMNEVIVNAPMIALSGGAALAGRAALSAGAAALVNSGRLASVGLKIAEGAKIAATASSGAKAAHWFGRAYRGMETVQATGRTGKALYWTGKTGGLLAEGALFEGVHSALQGENLLAAPDWFRRILWSSATLGTLHFTAGKAKQLTDFITKNSTRLFPDKTVRNIIMKVFVSGNITAGSMLAIGAIRHGYEVGDYEDFDVVKELFRSYILIGALGVGHGAVRVGGRTFLPGGGKPGGKGAGRLKRMREHEAKESAGVDIVARIKEAGKGGRSPEIKIDTAEGFTKNIETLKSEGYKLEATEDGRILARKGSTEIYIKPDGKFAKNFGGFLAEAKDLKALGESAQAGKLIEGFQAKVQARLQSMLARLKSAGFSKAQALVLLAVTSSGCAEVAKVSVGAGKTLGWGITTGVPIAGGITGAWLLIGSYLKIRGPVNARGAVKRADQFHTIADDVNSGTLNIAAQRINMRNLLTDITSASKNLGELNQHLRLDLNTFVRHAKAFLNEANSATPNRTRMNNELTQAKDSLDKMEINWGDTFSLRTGWRLGLGLGLIFLSLQGYYNMNFGGDADAKEEEDLIDLPDDNGVDEPIIDDSEDEAEVEPVAPPEPKRPEIPKTDPAIPKPRPRKRYF